METATLALLISALSLSLSLYTIVRSRRTAQLQKLAEVRSKLFSLKLNNSRRLALTNKFNAATSRIVGESVSTDEIEKHIEVLTKLEQALERAFLKYSRFPLTFPMGLVEETEHHIDCMVVQHDLWEKDFYPRINLLIEKASNQGRYA